jgi:hypothetical protein
MKHHLAKLKIAKAHGKTYTCKNTYLQRKQQDNQQMVKKKRQQTYNVIFIWDKKLNLNPKLFSTLY